MRAHCIDFYDEQSNPLGDMWLSNASRSDRLHIDLTGVLDEDDMLDLNEGQVRDLNAACVAFLAERAEAHASRPSPRQSLRTEGDQSHG